MRTVNRNTAKYACKNDYQLNEQARRDDRDNKTKENCGTKRCRNSFLTTPISPIGPKTVYADGDDGGLNLITQENYEFLRDSYFRYAELMNVKATHKPGKGLGESIANLYREMCDLVGESANVNFETTEGRLHFNLWLPYSWDYLTLFCFPLKFVETLNPTLKRIVITFLHDFQMANSISSLPETDFWEYITDLMIEEDEEITKPYMNNGKADRLFTKISSKSYYKNLSRAIDQYKCNNDFETKLIALLREGLEFTYGDKNIMSYAYDYLYDYDRATLPICLVEQILFVYEFDTTVDIYEQMLGEQESESYQIVPCNTLLVTPQTDKLLSETNDPYPEKFCNWAGRFIAFIR